MKTAAGCTVISNGTAVLGTGAAPARDATVIIRDGKIDFVGPAKQAPVTAGTATVIDARGGTILPGLIEAHFHPTYFNIEALEDLDIKYPVEYVTLLAASNARLALECGYTSARSGGSLFNVDVWLKKALESDLVVGPRLAASGREICGVGGLMDWNPDFRKIGMEGLVLLVNGPDEARAAAFECCYVLLCGRMQPHVAVHRGGDEEGSAGGKGYFGQRVAGQAQGQLRD